MKYYTFYKMIINHLMIHYYNHYANDYNKFYYVFNKYFNIRSPSRHIIVTK